MFTLDSLRALLNAQPFLPFRLHLSSGGTVDVRSREQVLGLRAYAVVALLDPQATDMIYDRYINVWYMHVVGVEMLTPGPPALGPPPSGPAGSPAPTPA
jgi:hypothetical protein